MTAQLDRPQYGFTSMGIPEATLEELAALAAEHALDFIEVRALEGSIDLPAHFATHAYPAEPVDPPVRLVATNLSLINATPETISTFLQYADVAAALGAPYVRVFGGGKWGDLISQDQFRHAAETVHACRAALKEKSAPCEMLLETHLAFSSSHACLRLNERLPEPLHILWDVHHTWRNACEMPAETWALIGSLARHMHFSDSRMRTPTATGYDCILPGAGEYPVDALRDLLAQVDYRHGVSLEWEKIWNPEMPHIREALPEFRRLLIDPKS